MQFKHACMVYAHTSKVKLLEWNLYAQKKIQKDIGLIEHRLYSVLVR